MRPRSCSDVTPENFRYPPPYEFGPAFRFLLASTQGAQRCKTVHPSPEISRRNVSFDLTLARSFRFIVRDRRSVITRLLATVILRVMIVLLHGDVCRVCTTKRNTFDTQLPAVMDSGYCFEKACSQHNCTQCFVAMIDLIRMSKSIYVHRYAPTACMRP